jgi:hypothetical protein
LPFFFFYPLTLTTVHYNFQLQKPYPASASASGTIPKIMGPFNTLLASLVAAIFISQSTAHFLLNYPPTIGFNDALEGNAPCGSFTPDFSTDTVTDFHVAGDSLAMTSIHPEATWLFRATLDITASGNWTILLPAVLQTGLGDYCERDVTVPASWAGSKGIIGVVQDAPDGILYQVSQSLCCLLGCVGT